MDNLAILECNVGTLLYEKKKERFKPLTITSFLHGQNHW